MASGLARIVRRDVAGAASPPPREDREVGQKQGAVHGATPPSTQTTQQNTGTGSRGASAARPAARRPAAKPKPAATPAPAPRASSFDAGDAWDANDDLDDILGDGWDDDSPTSKSVSPPPRSLSSLSGAVSPAEDSDDDFFASLGMESKPAFSKGRSASFRK